MEYMLYSSKSMKPMVSTNALIFVQYGSMSVVFGPITVALFFEGILTVQLQALRPQCLGTHTCI